MLASSGAVDGDSSYSMERDLTNSFQVMQEPQRVTEAAGNKKKQH